MSRKLFYVMLKLDVERLDDAEPSSQDATAAFAKMVEAAPIEVGPDLLLRRSWGTLTDADPKVVLEQALVALNVAQDYVDNDAVMSQVVDAIVAAQAAIG